MYYKLLNKNILTGILASVVVLGTTQVKAEDTDTAGASKVIDAPANQPVKPGDKRLGKPMDLPAPVEAQADIIPLDNGIITPVGSLPAEPEPEVLEEKPIIVLEAETIEAPNMEKTESFDDDFDVLLNTPEVPDETFPAENANTQPQEGIQGPQQNMGNPQTNASLPGSRPNGVQAPADTAKPQLTPEMRQEMLRRQQAEQEQKSKLRMAENVLVQMNDDLFAQMSDIEKQTTLLTLELKREKMQNEVEAARAVRERAEQEKLNAEKNQEMQELAFKKEQEAKVIQAEQALREKEIELEKLYQRKVLNSYMNALLTQKQAWIAENANLYEQIKTLKEEKKALNETYKANLEELTATSEKTLKSAEDAKNNYDRTVASLMAQNAQLKKRLEADSLANQNRGQNPFAGEGEDISSSSDSLIKPINIAKEYAIMEIIGKNEDLLVKLINKEGDSFMARVGTVLQTGHSIEEITPTYVQFDRNGLKDYLYTATSTLAAEPNKLEEQEEPEQPAQNIPGEGNRRPANLVSEQGIPSLGSGMFVK